MFLNKLAVLPHNYNSIGVSILVLNTINIIFLLTINFKLQALLYKSAKSIFKILTNYIP